MTRNDLLKLTIGLSVGCLAELALAKPVVIVDADTANEVDDLFAVARAAVASEWNLASVTAAQWQASHWSVPKSMEESHRLNQMILAHLGQSTPTYRGGPDRLYDWGDQAQHSAAAYEIIRQAKAMPSGQKLKVLALGALTNVASALLIEPAIGDKVAVYWLGSQYDFSSGTHAIDDFNCMMDMQALFKIFNSTVELHVLPLNVASALVMDFNTVRQKLAGKHPLADFLLQRWQQHIDPLKRERVVWDLALVSAVMRPDWAEETVITTPALLGGRQIKMYQSINARAIEADFYSALSAYFKRQS
ncbi:nucleoside hydrolase [Simiduia agarivorans]|uniref:Inosine/uridine-preferring nucleoside hydrolase n=1 Tax=Simiduia agarivorans (strain DSM 21679 / JCM 13881 / BCRC 17597 / SA1) TaxID=1117647 RepID=K4KMR7_SIMAS|nr:nucleoside hydrolase [Simiduia agarivorans]AFV00470.1 inosine/uridine-preferring nucleoside hydrolase [Simiduia agarivorans SA1 = DSM 21679]